MGLTRKRSRIQKEKALEKSEKDERSKQNPPWFDNTA